MMRSEFGSLAKKLGRALERGREVFYITNIPKQPLAPIMELAYNPHAVERNGAQTIALYFDDEDCSVGVYIENYEDLEELASRFVIAKGTKSKKKDNV